MFGIDDYIHNANGSGNFDVAAMWTQTLNYKKDFLLKQNSGRCFQKPDPIIINSWIRSEQLGIDPECRLVGYKPKVEEEAGDIGEEKSRILAATISIINSYKDFLDFSEYLLAVFYKDGTILYTEGNKKTRSLYENINVIPGVIWNEETGGTLSHELSISLKRAVQLLEPEHYCSAFNDKFGSAAPLFNENREVIGSVVIGLILDNGLEKITPAPYRLNILCLAISIAQAIQSQMESVIQGKPPMLWGNAINNNARNNGKETPSPQKILPSGLESDSSDNSPAGYHFHHIIGESTAMKKAKALAERFALSPENILLIGESGTGKELFAQAIHNQSRPEGPFIAVNCAAIPKELIESELFGYEGGSFTGAEKKGKPGKIELAAGGTLFLDEIGDMPLAIQSVLLRVLEDKHVMRIGGNRYQKIDFRLVAATNKNISALVRENLFREDLYYRLSVLCIDIPPLRQRENDAILISESIIENYCRSQGRKIPRISPAVQQLINQFDWPGNVRQLRNVLVYAINTMQNDIILPENLPDYLKTTSCIPQEAKEDIVRKIKEEQLTLKDWETIAIKNTLLAAKNSAPLAADLLNISRSTLYRKLKEYNIQY
ncbi:sigma-54 interaction domain-containing protein [Desulfitobacterium sp. AusDCA]|uniref:sigma-54 interaction domain-containing protein n=1 Tax=Desulfitobacterium sp. AusDCA TaxID=3240383 RepID=UPI003DA7377E